jgi:hypothetical protein
MNDAPSDARHVPLEAIHAMPQRSTGNSAARLKFSAHRSDRLMVKAIALR